MIKTMLLAGIGGFIGTCGRFLFGKLSNVLFSCAFPLGTFSVNIIGCFIIGIIMGLLDRHNTITSAESALLVTGFCGGFTTFSAFANEAWTLGNKGQWAESLIYICASVVIGVLAVWGGRAIAR